MAKRKKKPQVAQKHFFNFNNLCYQLILEEPFYAEVLRNLIREETDKIPTAAVSFDYRRGRFKLMVNPEFMSYMPLHQQKGVIKHEIFHIIFNHLTSRKPSEDWKMRLWNVATDLAINSHIVDELPNNIIIPCISEDEPAQFCIPGAVGPYEEMPAFKSAEWYMNRILQDAEFIQMAMNGEGTVDDHSQWDGEGGGSGQQQGDDEGSSQGSGDDGDEEGKGSGSRMGEEHLKRAEARRLAEQAQNEAVKKGWGSVSQALQSEIQVLLKHTINWKGVLRYFVKKSQRGDKYSTFKRPNRRWRDKKGNPLAPGRNVHRHANIAVAVDESGSMSDQFLSNLIAELQGLSKFATFTVIPFDTQVCTESIFKWKKGQKLAGHYKRTSTGGTDFNAPVNFVNKDKNFDAIIILTDLCAPTPVPSKVPRMWITSEYYQQTYGNEYLDTGRDLVLAIPNDG